MEERDFFDERRSSARTHLPAPTAGRPTNIPSHGWSGARKLHCLGMRTSEIALACKAQSIWCAATT